MWSTLFQAVAFVWAPSFLATPEGAYRTRKRPQHGIESQVPRKYDTVPSQPTDVHVVRKMKPCSGRTVAGQLPPDQESPFSWARGPIEGGGRGFNQ